MMLHVTVFFANEFGGLKSETLQAKAYSASYVRTSRDFPGQSVLRLQLDRGSAVVLGVEHFIATPEVVRHD